MDVGTFDTTDREVQQAPAGLSLSRRLEFDLNARRGTQSGASCALHLSQQQVANVRTLGSP